MQCDIDLLRQLLFDIERRGATCAIDVLRAEAGHDGDERVRFHLRLLSDAGLVREAGQTAAGASCVRLTYDGHEFVELARSDARWREAKAAVIEATGSLPLSIVRSLLAKWAWRAVVRGQRRRVARGRRPFHRYLERFDPDQWMDAYASEPETLWDDDQSRLVRERSAYRERSAAAAWEGDLYGDVAAELATAPADSLLPEQYI